MFVIKTYSLSSKNRIFSDPADSGLFPDDDDNNNEEDSQPSFFMDPLKVRQIFISIVQPGELLDEVVLENLERMKSNSSTLLTINTNILKP